MRKVYLAYAYEIILKFLALVVLFPVIISLLYKQYDSAIPFVVTSAISFCLSLLFRLYHSSSNIENLNDIKKSEAYKSGYISGTIPDYDSYADLRKLFVSSIEEG